MKDSCLRDFCSLLESRGDECSLFWRGNHNAHVKTPHPEKVETLPCMSYTLLVRDQIL